MSLDLFRPMPLIIVELHISETNGLDLRLTHQHRRLIIRKQAKLGFLAAAEPPKTAGGSAWPPRPQGIADAILWRRFRTGPGQLSIIVSKVKKNRVSCPHPSGHQHAQPVYPCAFV